MIGCFSIGNSGVSVFLPFGKLFFVFFDFSSIYLNFFAFYTRNKGIDIF